MLATAREDGVIRDNPAAGVRLSTRATRATIVASERVGGKALTEVELARLLDELPERWRPFVAFVAQTGLRISEAVAVRWGDVDMVKGRLTVRRRYRLGQFAAPKSRSSRRVIPLSSPMLTLLASRRDGAPDDALAWPSGAGTPLDADNLASRVLKPAARRAGVGWASWHTLRHTCGSLLFRHGANAKQVQQWLGHHSPAFTLAVYVHLLPEDAPDATILGELAPIAPGQQRVNKAPRDQARAQEA